MHISRKDLSSGLACGGLPGGSILVFGIFFLRRMIFVTDALGDTVFMLNTCVCIQDALTHTLQQPDQRQFFLTTSSIMNSCFISRSVVWED